MDVANTTFLKRSEVKVVVGASKWTLLSWYRLGEDAE
jgi:hypothetical protein